MRMTTCVLSLVFGLLAYVRSASTSAETVWLKDVTIRFQTDKRTLGDTDLPFQLTFHLRRGSDDLTLNLRRNYEIDPNADIYFVEKLKDGRSILKKETNLEKEELVRTLFSMAQRSVHLVCLYPSSSGRKNKLAESPILEQFPNLLEYEHSDVAYYQDMDNGAYMTVRCVKRSNQQCERVINGNIQIGSRSYDLQSAETIDTSEDLFKVPHLLGKRYLLRDQTNIQLEHSVENKDEANVNEINVAMERKAPFQLLTGQDKRSYFWSPDVTLSSRNVAYLHDSWATVLKDHNERIKHGKTRQLKNDYYVKVAVLIDSGVWDIFSSRVKVHDPRLKRDEVQKKIREAYSHVMNGVNLRYKSVEDQSISISVILQRFLYFETEVLFPHKLSMVVKENGKKYIDVHDYLYDFSQWANETGANYVPAFDHAMLFTTHKLYVDSISNSSVSGLSYINGICDESLKVSVIEVRDYARTVLRATHELGHNLGAEHDGEKDAIACKADDFYIMTPRILKLDKNRVYIKNLWSFSNCSVESFKKQLKDKDCVKNPGSVFSVDEWTMYMTKQAGDVFTPDEQCYFFHGPGSVFSGEFSEEICHLLRCKNQVTGRRMKAYINAARGTKCGDTKWCIDGRCVSKDSK